MLCLLYSDFVRIPYLSVFQSLGAMCLSGIVVFPGHLHLF